MYRSTRYVFIYVSHSNWNVKENNFMKSNSGNSTLIIYCGGKSISIVEIGIL